LYPNLADEALSPDTKTKTTPLSDPKVPEADEDSDDANLGLSVEEQVAREVAKLRRPQKQKRFGKYRVFPLADRN
jgi:hypothetical protein